MSVSGDVFHGGSVADGGSVVSAGGGGGGGSVISGRGVGPDMDAGRAGEFSG